MPLISDPFLKQRGERNRAGPCGCQAIVSRSAWSLRGRGGHISRTCGPQSWLGPGKSGCSFWGYFATQNVSHAVGATDLDLHPLLLISMGAKFCLQSQQFVGIQCPQKACAIRGSPSERCAFPFLSELQFFLYVVWRPVSTCLAASCSGGIPTAVRQASGKWLLVDTTLVFPSAAEPCMEGRWGQTLPPSIEMCAKQDVGLEI